MPVPRALSVWKLPCSCQSRAPDRLLSPSHPRSAQQSSPPSPPIAFDTMPAPSSAPTPSPSSPSPSPANAASSSASRTAPSNPGSSPSSSSRHLTIEADVEGYAVPIDVNQQSAAHRSPPRPHHHHLLPTPASPSARSCSRRPTPPHGTGPIVLFEFDCLHPTDFTFRFTPDCAGCGPSATKASPAPNGSRPPHRSDCSQAASTSSTPITPTSPAPSPSPAHPRHPRPLSGTPPGPSRRTQPPHRPRTRRHGAKPLPSPHGRRHRPRQPPPTPLSAHTLDRLNTSHPRQLQGPRRSLQKAPRQHHLHRNPRQALNEAFQWAVVSIEQLKAQSSHGQSSRHYRSGPDPSPKPDPCRNRPRRRLLRLRRLRTPRLRLVLRPRRPLHPLRRQRLRRLRPHPRPNSNSSSTASAPTAKSCTSTRRPPPTIDWQPFPYMYAAADATPLFLMAMRRLRTAPAATPPSSPPIAKPSKKPGPLKPIPPTTPTTTASTTTPGHRLGRKLARRHAPSGDLPRPPRPASLLRHGLYRRPASATPPKPAAAQHRADAKSPNHQHRILRPAKRLLRLQPQPATAQQARHHHHRLSRHRLVGPGPATTANPRPSRSLPSAIRRLSHSTPTGALRDVANTENFYDGLSYHQGSVWPLFTGWAALAEYRANQPLAGYQILMENANLTWAQDLGAVTELLSRRFLRSLRPQHQPSALVQRHGHHPNPPRPLRHHHRRPTKTITVNPHLPAHGTTPPSTISHCPTGEKGKRRNRSHSIATELCSKSR